MFDIRIMTQLMISTPKINSFCRVLNVSHSLKDLSGHPLGKKLSRPFQDLESYLQEVEDTEYR